MVQFVPKLSYIKIKQKINESSQQMLFRNTGKIFQYMNNYGLEQELGFTRNSDYLFTFFFNKNHKVFKYIFI